MKAYPVYSWDKVELMKFDIKIEMGGWLYRNTILRAFALVLMQTLCIFTELHLIKGYF